MENKKKTTRLNSYSNELKIRFKTKEGVDLLKRFKKFCREDHEGSINQISEDLMIPQMKSYIADKVGINEMLNNSISNSMDKLSKTLSKSVKNQLDQISYEIQTNSSPIDLKLSLLTNLLADKEVIDSLKIDSPEPALLSDPLFITKYKAKLDKERLNKEKNAD